jgi:hypothetical protein
VPAEFSKLLLVSGKADANAGLDLAVMRSIAFEQPKGRWHCGCFKQRRKLGAQQSEIELTPQASAARSRLGVTALFFALWRHANSNLR